MRLTSLESQLAEAGEKLRQAEAQQEEMQSMRGARAAEQDEAAKTREALNVAQARVKELEERMVKIKEKVY